ncbi:MAG: fold, partial [Pseudomonadota bacterium]
MSLIDLPTDLPSAEEMVAASPIAMLVLDPAGAIKRVNAAAEMLLNLSAQTIIGRQISDLLVMPD